MDHEALVALHASLMRNIVQLQGMVEQRDGRIAELEAHLPDVGQRTNGQHVEEVRADA